MKKHVNIGFWILLFICTFSVQIIHAQTSRNLGLTGGPDNGVYPGFEMDGTFNVTFNNVPGTNPTANTPLQAGSLQIVLALPPGIEFSDSYTPPSGWSYSKLTATSAVLTQIAPVSSTPPLSIVTFAVPFKTKAEVVAGTWSAQIQRLLPTYQDPDATNSTPSGEVSVRNVNLPVTLIAFHVGNEQGISNLTWSTTQEVNSDYFEVQHSVNAKNWITLGSVKSTGESNKTVNYSFKHLSPASGSNYYRLKMVDNDASYSYSSIKKIQIETKDAIVLYPNPASENLYVDSHWSIQNLTIFDSSGKKITSPTSVPPSGINVTHLPNGKYILQMQDNNGITSTHTFLVAH